VGGSLNVADINSSS